MSGDKLRPVTTSTFELFKVGIGPSSSHTVGPLVACRNFCRDLVLGGHLDSVSSVKIELCGSLALTGIGHYTNKACVLGLTGVAPAEVDTANIDTFLDSVAASGKLTIGCPGKLLGDGCAGSYKEIDFVETRDVILLAQELPLHPNGMVCQALDAEGCLLMEITYYSIGGGFIKTEAEMLAQEAEAQGVHMSDDDDDTMDDQETIPLPFRSMKELVEVCQAQGLSVAEVMRRNEEAKRSPGEVDAALAEIWRVMENCVERGLSSDKEGQLLPGPLRLQRRAPGLHKQAQCEEGLFFGIMDEMRWLDSYALAVMEENANMGQVVTAPTNGASGVVPATLTYYMRHLRPKQPEAKRNSPGTFLLTAAAVGIITKERATISGAEGGCQAEVGTASAMAAAGLCAVMGGSPEQVAEAAEIAMEHSLGMTCDPVLGLVQVPCIERNTMGANKALNAVSLVMKAPATNRRAMIGYYDIIRVMKKTGEDMSAKYRETAQGGIANDYEAYLKGQPELWEEVQKMMGVGRVLAGSRRKPKRKVTYEDLEVMRKMSSHKEVNC
jgi:L-serine dehydratase